MKTVTYTRIALKDLKRHAKVAARIRQVMNEYAADPRWQANNVTQLAGSSARRMRVGDYRVIFEEGATEILVTRVGPRGDVYEWRGAP